MYRVVFNIETEKVSDKVLFKDKFKTELEAQTWIGIELTQMEYADATTKNFEIIREEEY